LCVFPKRKYPKITSKMQVSFVNETQGPLPLLACLWHDCQQKQWLSIFKNHSLPAPIGILNLTSVPDMVCGYAVVEVCALMDRLALDQ
jgi:hypothetical protein